MDPLISPLLYLAAAVLGLMVVTDYNTVYVETVEVPESLTQVGYSGEVVRQRVMDNILAIERQAHTRRTARRLALQAEPGALESIAEYLQITPIVRTLQGSAGLLEYVADADIVANADQLVLTLEVRHRDGRRMDVTLRRPVADIEPLLNDGAHALMFAMQPSTLCAALLRHAIGYHATSYDEARRCVDKALTNNLGSTDWLHNLAGVVRFLQGDQAAAFDHFRQAIDLNPDLSPALLNVGVLHALNGRHEDAIKSFETVLRKPTLDNSPQTYAANYVEWGESLAALGRSREAGSLYVKAIRADPLYVEAYERLAEAIRPDPRADELQRRADLARQKEEQIYTENLVGVIQYRGAAKMVP